MSNRHCPQPEGQGHFVWKLIPEAVELNAEIKRIKYAAYANDYNNTFFTEDVAGYNGIGKSDTWENH